jgi:hypothetical protein
VCAAAKLGRKLFEAHASNDLLRREPRRGHVVHRALDAGDALGAVVEAPFIYSFGGSTVSGATNATPSTERTVW